MLSAYNKGVERIVIAAGVRWGKSALCGYIALRTFLQGLNDIKSGERDSIKIWIVAPSYELTKKVFEYIIKWLLKIRPELENTISYRPYPQIKLAEGVWIQGKSATEPHSLLGEELDLIIFDEAAVTSPDIWEVYLSARLISRDGKVIFISTPFGQNWFYNEFLRAQENGGAFNFRTLDNPTLENPERVKELEKQLPKNTYLQNYEASFLPDAASVFPTIEKNIADNILSDAIMGHQYIMGWDPAKHEDYSAICVIDTFKNHVVHLERLGETFYPFQKVRVTAVAKRYNNARIIIDSSGVGEPLSDDLRREGLFVITDFHFSGKSKSELIQNGQVRIEQMQVWIPPDAQSGTPLVAETKSYGYQISDKGTITYGAPQGLHDDMTTAFLLAVWGLPPGRAVFKTAMDIELEKGQRDKKLDNYI